MDPSPPPVTSSPRAVEFFDASATDYARKHYDDAVRTFMTVRQERVLEFVDRLRLPRGAAALDAGCGPGHLVLALAARGLRVSAMDGADGMLREARERVEAAGPAFPVDFRQGDIEALPYADASFDLVCSTGVIEYLSGDEAVLREFHRVLRPGGALILPVTNGRSPALWLDGIIEPLKRQEWLMRPFNALWQRLGRTPILPRAFTVRTHRVAGFREAVSRAGFEILDGVHFHLLPWPRPLDQLLPGLTARLGARLERRARGPLGAIGEGYVVVARRRVG